MSFVIIYLINGFVPFAVRFHKTVYNIISILTKKLPILGEGKDNKIKEYFSTTNLQHVFFFVCNI